MYYEKRIKKLNKDIKRSNRRIRNLKITDNILVLLPGVALLTCSTVFTYCNRNSKLALDAYAYELVASLVLGAFLADVDNAKINNKINREKELIKKNINELHGYALLENKKRNKNEN